MVRLVVWLLLSAALVGACASDAPEVPLGPDGEPDPVLLLGRDVFSERCVRCHGSNGNGNLGPKISGGSTVERFPEIDDQIGFVSAGRGIMPAFGKTLSDPELEAVVRFVREVL